MLTFIQTEFLKLKGSNIFLLSILGAVFTAFLVFLMSLVGGPTPEFKSLFESAHFCMSGILAIFLYTIMIAYLFGREYNENTLKMVLTIPISRGKFIISKYAMFLIWILILTSVTVLSTLGFGLILGAKGLTLSVIGHALYNMIYSNILLYLAFTPFIFVSLIVTSMVPAMIGGGILTLVNMVVYNMESAPLIPWISPFLIASGDIVNYTVSTNTSQYIILLTFVVGLVISYIYFTKTDVKL